MSAFNVALTVASSMYLLVTAAEPSSAFTFPFRMPGEHPESTQLPTKRSIHKHAAPDASVGDALFHAMQSQAFEIGARGDELDAVDCLQFAFETQRLGLSTVDQLMPLCNLKDKPLCRQLAAGLLGARAVKDRAQHAKTQKVQRAHSVPAYDSWCLQVKHDLSAKSSGKAGSDLAKRRALRSQSSATASVATTTSAKSTTTITTTTVATMTTAEWAVKARPGLQNSQAEASSTAEGSLQRLHSDLGSLQSVHRQLTSTTSTTTTTTTTTIPPMTTTTTTTSMTTTTTTTTTTATTTTTTTSTVTTTTTTTLTTTTTATATMTTTMTKSKSTRAMTTTTATTTMTATITKAAATTTTMKTTVAPTSTTTIQASKTRTTTKQVRNWWPKYDFNSDPDYNFMHDADSEGEHQSPTWVAHNFVPSTTAASSSGCICVHRTGGKRRCSCPAGVAPPPLTHSDKIAEATTTTTTTTTEQASWVGAIASLVR